MSERDDENVTDGVRLSLTDMRYLVGSALGTGPACWQRLETMEGRGVVCPEGVGRGRGHHKRYRVIDALAAHYAAAWQRPFAAAGDKSPLLLEPGFHAGEYLQWLGLNACFDRVRSGDSCLVPMLDPHHAAAPAWVCPACRPLNVKGEPVRWPDLADSFAAVRGLLAVVMRREYAGTGRRHPADPEAAARAVAELTELLQQRQGTVPQADE